MNAPIVFERDADLGRGLFGREVPRDFFLRRHKDFQIAFDDGLACERVTGFQIVRAQAHRRAAPRIAALDDDGASSTTTLPAARYVDVNAGALRGFGNEDAVWHLDGYIGWLEVNFLGGDGNTSELEDSG